MRVYRAAADDDAWQGYRSFWTPSREHAERYLDRPGFGGPVLYFADVDPRPCLDLRHDPWSVLADMFTLERHDYGAGLLDHDILQDLAAVFAASGYRWVRWQAVGGPQEADEWMYLGQEPLAARRVTDERLTNAGDESSI